MFVKTGDAVPFNTFDHNGNPLSEEDIKKECETKPPKDDKDNNTDKEVDDEQK